MLSSGITVARRRAGCLGLVLVLSGVVCGVTAGEERYYVTREGTKIRMTQSTTELGVLFWSAVDVPAAKVRFAASKRGELGDVAGFPDSPLKILRVSDVSRKRRQEIQKEAAVRVAGKVYRFEGSSIPVVAARRIVVRLRPEVTEVQRANLWSDYRLHDVRAMKRLPGVYSAVLEEGLDEVLIAERLAEDPFTVWANPDLIRPVRRMQVPPPSDEFFEEQWHLDNTGQSGTEDADIDALEAWAIADGEGVLFGMYDDSCDVDHEDLQSRYIGTGQDVWFLPGEPGYDDPRPKSFGDHHGTSVMGLAVATANTLGVRGVSSSARFTASRPLLAFEFEVASAMAFAIEQGVDVHINSWGYPDFLPDSPVVKDAIEAAFLEGRDADGPGGDDPLGMLIFFASGNGDFNGIGIESEPGFALAALPTTISVGATDHDDKLAVFSNFGDTLNFVAPGTSGIATTDVQDGVYFSDGYNSGGFLGFSVRDIDPGGNYTGDFGGTSAATPIAAGVAGLVLSVNPNLTATDVRILMEHTCDQISPDDAEYNGISSRSFTYGYGRINAHQAVLSAEETLTNGRITWPDHPQNVRVQGSLLSWRPGVGTEEVLVVQSSLDFAFVPEDGVCYDARQLNCSTATLVALPENVAVTDVVGGCGGECPTDLQQSLSFVPPAVGKTFFALYGSNSIGRYSFGVPTDSTGESTGGGGTEDIPPPAITIAATPLVGDSPLRVQFNGNGVTALGIDPSKTAWDFEFDPIDGFSVDAQVAKAEKIYEAAPGEEKRFRAVLRMTDVGGTTGAASVDIRVTGPADPDSVVSEGDLPGVRITAEAGIAPIDERCRSSLCGEAPFDIVFNLSTETTDATLTVDAVLWDLGDGTISTNQSVFHSYVNSGELSLVLPVTATVTLRSSTGDTVTTSMTELVSILPGTGADDDGSINLPGTEVRGEGGSASPCGTVTLIPLVFSLGLVFLRRVRFVSSR